MFFCLSGCKKNECPPLIQQFVDSSRRRLLRQRGDHDHAEKRREHRQLSDEFYVGDLCNFPKLQNEWTCHDDVSQAWAFKCTLVAMSSSESTVFGFGFVWEQNSPQTLGQSSRRR